MRYSQRRSQVGVRAAYTLVELLLALALSVVLMALVGTTFTFYATKLDARDLEVRRVKLAYGIMSMLSEDLRGTLYPPEFDPSSLEASLDLGAGGGGAQPGEGEDLSAAGLDDLSGEEEEPASLASGETVETADLASGTVSTQRPGLLGNQTQIQFDVSRLPRLEEYQRLIQPNEAGTIVDVPSDIKTVSYYIQADGGGVTDPLDLASTSGTAPRGSNGGLVRRSIDRSLTQWALQNGGMASLTSAGDLLATEAVAIQFRYWDGLQWQIFWDSDEMGAVPMAIEVTLTMMEQQADPNESMSMDVTRQYTQIIRIPMGRPVEQQDAGLSAAGI
ncbi:hypothetical protein SH139x_004693 [Planctomycetaceae bacterium SH139]